MSVAVRSEKALLISILRNLISNAIRFTTEGGVLLGCQRRGANQSIKVWDTGVGIAADQLDEIFEEYRRVGVQSDDGQPGLGLGLAIVKRIAAILGITPNVLSHSSQGSQIYGKIPIEKR